MLGPFDLNLVWTSLPELFSGLVVTLQLSVLTVLGGILLSVPLGGPNFIELPDGSLIAGSRGFGKTPGFYNR